MAQNPTPRRRAPKSAEKASQLEKSNLLLTLGLMLLVGSWVIAIFEVGQVRETVTPNFIYGSGCLGCIICCLMSGHLNIKQLAALGDFIGRLLPKIGSAQ